MRTPDLYRLLASSTVLKERRCTNGWRHWKFWTLAGLGAVGLVWPGALRAVDISRAHCRGAVLANDKTLVAARAIAAGCDMMSAGAGEDSKGSDVLEASNWSLSPSSDDPVPINKIS